jgi:preprotein translocase subunit SecG
MLARIGGALWWLFIAFLFIGLPLLYMANQKRRKGSQKGSQRAET